MDTELIDFKGEQGRRAPSNEKINDTKVLLTAMIDAGIPVIMTLSVMQESETGEDYVDARHAVVVAGYEEDTETKHLDLLLHDDQIGPYCLTTWRDNSVDLENEWIREWGWKRLMVENLVIPLYPKIRASLIKMVPWFQEVKAKMRTSHGYDTEFRFYTVRAYKNELLTDPLVRNKPQVLTSRMPRFMIVFRMKNGSKKIEDHWYDATEAFPNKSVFNIIEYKA